ncbi:hypothetical protein FQN54_001361 [Arachnomyces sp. PD_36]|nr:hypothetical protein FQN54_001361 [Arachnomyces sp. PD_36]
MATSFSGRSIAITASAALKFLSGGASGIGLAVARGLSLQGASVYIADAAKESPAELQNQRNVYYTGECDITNRGACKRFIDSIPDRLDGLVNCAGICPAEGKQPSDDVFERIMAVNTTGTWNIGTEAIRRMSQQEQRQQPGLIPGTERSLPAGSIVNIGSGASLRGIADMAAYCASKHAVLGLTRSWAKDWPSLRVNMVAPGKSIVIPA